MPPGSRPTGTCFSGTAPGSCPKRFHDAGGAFEALSGRDDARLHSRARWWILRAYLRMTKPSQQAGSTGLTEAPEDLGGLQAAVNESSRSVRRTFVTFMLVVAYIAVIVATTTDEQLLRGHAAVRLPILGVQVSIPAFYFVAPWIVVALHFNLLLGLTLLSAKLLQLGQHINAMPKADERARQRALLDDSILTQFLVGRSEGGKGLAKLRTFLVVLQVHAIVRTTIWVLPLLVLLWLQGRFLPYHGETILHWQRVAVLIDMIVLWAFWFSVSSGMPERGSVLTDGIRWLRRLKISSRAAAVACGVLASAAVLLASFGLLTTSESAWWEHLPRGARDLFPRNLELSEGLLAREESTLERGQGPEAGPTVRVESLDLRHRDLRFAELTRADLTNADFRWADLQCAALGDARLRGARLTVGEWVQGAYQTVGARLRGAQLWHVEIPEAFLYGADLQFSYDQDAELPGADLREADLLGARTRGMELQGADLRRARLRATDSLLIDLRGADLRDAQFQGADLSFADLRAADLRGAQLQGAELRGAHLDAADLRGASIWNASFKDASLRLADLRGISAVAPTQQERSKWLEDAQKIQDQVNWKTLFWVGSATDRLRAAMQEKPASVFAEPTNHEDAIYDRNGFLAHWGDPPEMGLYRRKVVAYIATLLCRDSQAAKGVLCQHPEPGENRIPELVPHTSYIPGLVDPRTAGVFQAMANCESLSQLPRGTLEALRNWLPGEQW